MARRSRPQPEPVEDNNPQLALPKVPCDPLASLPPTSILIDFIGHTWTIPAITADRWLRVIWTDPFDPQAIFPGFLQDEDAEDTIMDAIIDGDVDMDEMFLCAMEALEVAGGYQWWFTLRLVSTLNAGWSRIGGMLLNAGVDPTKLSLGAWCSAALEMYMANIEPRNAAELLEKLLERPEGFEARPDEPDVFDVFEDEAAFYAAMTGAF